MTVEQSNKVRCRGTVKCVYILQLCFLHVESLKQISELHIPFIKKNKKKLKKKLHLYEACLVMFCMPNNLSIVSPTNVPSYCIPLLLEWQV
jgi:hypothetical protein